MGAVEGGGGEFEGGVVARVGDNRFVLDAEVAEGELDQFIFEFKNVNETVLLRALKSSSLRLPVPTKIVKKYDKRTDCIKGS